MPKPEAPVDLAAVFQRMKLAVSDDEDGPDRARAARSIPPERGTDARPAFTRTALRPPVTADENSIDDYMVKLLSAHSRWGHRGRDGSQPARNAQSEPPGAAASGAGAAGRS